MNTITIRQAQANDIPVIESILLDTVNWLNEMGQPLWSIDDVTWETLSESYQISDFYIAFLNEKPSGCVIIVDYDPLFWPNIKSGESLFIHRLAVTKTARKSGVADELMNFFKKQGALRGVEKIRLDTHAYRPKVRAFYERHGFTFVEERVLRKNFYTAFYCYTIPAKDTEKSNDGV